MRPRPVMVVEDEPDLLENMKSLLEDEGYDVYCARNGQEALDILANVGSAPPGLVALDLTMPVMDGGAFLRVFAGTEAALGPNAPKVVLVTAAEVLPAGVALAEALPMLRKPINIDTLMNLVKQHCGPP